MREAKIGKKGNLHTEESKKLLAKNQNKNSHSNIN